MSPRCTALQAPKASRKQSQSLCRSCLARLFAPGEFGRGTTLVPEAALAAEWFQVQWQMQARHGIASRLANARRTLRNKTAVMNRTLL
eukprot:s2788_g2.t1